MLCLWWSSSTNHLDIGGVDGERELHVYFCWIVSKREEVRLEADTAKEMAEVVYMYEKADMPF